MHTAPDASRAPSATSQPTSASTTTPEARERLELLARLCASFPSQGDPDSTIRAYLADTADIPIAWLREGLRRFRDERGRTFLPSIAEVRTAVAEAVRDARRAARGDGGYAGAPQTELDVPAILRWARERAPLGHAQVARIEAGASRRRALEAGNAEAERTERGGQRGQGAGDALGAVLAGVRVVDDQGRELPVAKIADEIAAAGVLVPPLGHTDRGFAMQGRWLATCLALGRLGHPSIPSNVFEADFHRADRAMVRHRDETPGADTAWWFEGVREEWWRTSKRNEARGMGSAGR